MYNYSLVNKTLCHLYVLKYSKNFFTLEPFWLFMIFEFLKYSSNNIQTILWNLGFYESLNFAILNLFLHSMIKDPKFPKYVIREIWKKKSSKISGNKSGWHKKLIKHYLRSTSAALVPKNVSITANCSTVIDGPVNGKAI